MTKSTKKRSFDRTKNTRWRKMPNVNTKAKWRETKKRSFGTKNTRWKKMTKWQQKKLNG